MTRRYRCRSHPECEVTWRGTGCYLCGVEQAQRHRRAREPDDLEETIRRWDLGR
jgi:hypothetical protein